MNTQRIPAFIVCIMLFWPNQAVSKERPDWVEGAASDYPNELYITATASASERERAMQRALAKLSQLFETHIYDDASMQAGTRVTGSDDEESLIRKLALDRRVDLGSDTVISGARIADTWKDDEVFVYHALAVLERREAASLIEQELTRIDQETETQLNSSRSEQDVLLAMSALNRAIHLQLERRSIQNMLRIVDTSGVGRPSPYNLADLSADLDRQLLSLRIGAATDKDSMGKLEALLRSAMGNAGFPAQLKGTDFTLVASFDVQDLGQHEGWYWMRGKLELKLVGRDGKIRGRKEWPLKASALHHHDAESRLVSQLGEKLDEVVKPSMMEFAMGAH